MSEESELKHDIADKLGFLKDFADRAMRDLHADTVVSSVVLTTLIETTGEIAYQSGRYNEIKLKRQ